MLAFKFVNEEYKSPMMSYDPVDDPTDYSGPWPIEIENNDTGIHAVPYRENINWKSVRISDKIIMMEVDESDITVLEKNGTIKVNKATILREATDEEKNFIRTEVCRDSWVAWRFARDVDKHPREDTREAVCRDSCWAFAYAREIDKCPRDDTRAAACTDAFYAYAYALEVDQCPRDDTREAACTDAVWKKKYIEAFGE